MVENNIKLGHFALYFHRSCVHRFLFFENGSEKVMEKTWSFVNRFM